MINKAIFLTLVLLLSSSTTQAQLNELEAIYSLSSLVKMVEQKKAKILEEGSAQVLEQSQKVITQYKAGEYNSERGQQVLQLALNDIFGNLVMNTNWGEFCFQRKKDQNQWFELIEDLRTHLDDEEFLSAFKLNQEKKNQCE